MLRREGIAVVEDRCILTEHTRLFPARLFTCQRCGHCCQGRGGIVLGPRDLPRLAAHLGLSKEECLARHSEMRGGKPMLLCGEDGFCEFYRVKLGCTIHEARPDVCRAWPYFRGNLIDPVSFNMARADCPGIARDATHAAFAWEGFASLRAWDLLGTDPARDGRALIVHERELPARSPRTDGRAGSEHS
ncbi:MAG: YkgJ family cysteine cluster protein [Desulfovibrionaceae bacterium]|nr:YkgJ family cysteine cluster protein [Desulfovibrionaceae bacterium]